MQTHELGGFGGIAVEFLQAACKLVAGVDTLRRNWQML